MKVSARVRYGVMAMTALAQHTRSAVDGGCHPRPVALGDIAADKDLSLSYLEQLFAALRRAGLVRSVRGPGGGYVLTRCPETIPVAEIAVALEGPVQARCGQGAVPTCPTAALWDALGRRIDAFYASVTLADVAAGRLVARPGGPTDGDGAVPDRRVLERANA